MSPADSAQNRRRRILVAEDDRLTGTILRYALEREGYEVHVATDGAKAIAAAQMERFDLAIVDHLMPRATGVEVCGVLRRDPVHAEIPIAFCTGKGLELDVDAVRREFGVFEVFFKPFSVCDVLASLEAEWARSRSNTAPLAAPTAPSGRLH